MNITEKDLIGKIEGFPIQVVKKMIEYQVEAGNPASVEVFQEMANAGTALGGFNWSVTPEGNDFWDNIIFEHDFDLFFKKYPKLEVKKPKIKVSKQKVYECLSFLTGEPMDSFEIVD